jgi:uncharacterized membrane protein
MESMATQIAHWVTMGGVLTLVGFALKQHKVFIRIKDRVNSMWWDHCTKHAIKYEPLENGSK